MRLFSAVWASRKLKCALFSYASTADNDDTGALMITKADDGAGYQFWAFGIDFYSSLDYEGDGEFRSHAASPRPPHFISPLVS